MPKVKKLKTKKSKKVDKFKKKKIHKVLKEWKNEEITIGKSNKKVKSRKQAIAIALSEAGLSKKKKRSNK